MARLAWFSPMPPARTGVAVYSADVVAALRTEHEIDVFTDQPAPGARSAHDFLWEHHQRPYDLPVYQLGNSSFHDYIWPYLFRFPGLTVLHDAHLHHARAAQLLRVKRAQHYRDEFAANHPAAPPAMAELGVAGFDSYVYYKWPMRRLVVEASRATAVHARLIAEELSEDYPAEDCPPIETIRIAHGEPVEAAWAAAARARVRATYGIQPEQVVFGVFGALTPEKRLPQILDAFDALRAYEPGARLLLAGAIASHYDVDEEIARRNLGGWVVRTGYLPDEEVTGHLVACDVSLNLRWPTAREMSGPWLRALAAGLATVVVDLAHTADVPSLDPRTWTVSHDRPSGQPAPPPVTIAIDILDEAHSLLRALRRLATDAALRERLGRAAAEHWQKTHAMERMLDDYRAVIQRTLARPVPAPRAHWPSHLIDRGRRRLDELLSGVPGVRAAL